jgi:hypothetical protein
MAEPSIVYAGLVGSGSAYNWYNIAKDYAAVNAKNEEVTTRDGHVYGYLCNITLEGTGPSIISIVGAPNTWKMRNAVRKAHFLREAMFEDAGITKSEKGTYAQTIRPHLTTNMVTDAIYKVPQFLNPQGSPSTASMTGGEWSYTTLASSPSWDNTPVVDHTDLPLADTYTLAICGDNVEQDDDGGIKSWQTIGLINSYNIDRMEMIPDATTDTSIVGTNNPFAMLKSQSVVSGEVGEIAKDQELEAPPYDVADNGDSVEVAYKAVTQVNATESVRKMQVFLPAGLMAIYSTAAMTAALLHVEVVAKVLCKDMA